MFTSPVTAAPPLAGPAIELSAELKCTVEKVLLDRLNTGSIKELMRISGIGKKRAEGIVQHRDQLGELQAVRLGGKGRRKKETSCLENRRV